MLFSIPLFVFFSSICFLAEQMENHGNDQNNRQANYVETMKISDHQVEEPILNFQRKEMFKECRRNHASSTGGFALDGCCEFLPSGVEGTIEFFKCATCNCHRNFHHKEFITQNQTHFPSNTPCYPSPIPISTVFPIPNGYIHVTDSSSGATTSLDLPNGVVPVTTPINGGGEKFSNSKKRFRTKFTCEQKKNMLDFATKLGWKVHKQDENVVEDFCNKIGVKLQVFKVWVFNNKHTIGKQP